MSGKTSLSRIGACSVVVFSLIAYTLNAQDGKLPDSPPSGNPAFEFLNPGDIESIGEASEVLNAAGALPTYNNRTVGGLELVDRLDATFSVSIDFDAKFDGEREVIWEAGGGTRGFSLCYEAPNVLVLRAAANKGRSLAEIDAELTPEQIDGGEVDLAWTWDNENDEGIQEITLIINGAVVASTTEDLDPDWSGSNTGSFAAASTNLSGNGRNEGLSGADFTSGTINLDRGLAFFAGRKWSPVYEPGCPGDFHSAEIDCVLVINDNTGSDGASAYSFGVTANGGSITAITTEGTEAGSLIDDGFVQTELTSGEGNEGAVIGVLLSFNNPVTLPADGPSSVATLTVETAQPDTAAASIVSLAFVDSLQSAGQPVTATIIWQGSTWRPTLGTTSYAITSDVEAPAAPTGLDSAAWREMVTLDWDDNIEPDFSTYILRRNGIVIADGLGESGFVDTDVLNDVLYSYTVSASDSCGNESGESTELAATPYDPGIGPLQRGDSNGDGRIDISDGVSTLGFLFLGEGRPRCLAAADANRDGSVNVSDPSYTLGFLFLGGAVHPEPAACGYSLDDGDLEQGCLVPTCAE